MRLPGRPFDYPAGPSNVLTSVAVSAISSCNVARRRCLVHRGERYGGGLGASFEDPQCAPLELLAVAAGRQQAHPDIGDRQRRKGTVMLLQRSGRCTEPLCSSQDETVW